MHYNCMQFIRLVLLLRIQAVDDCLNIIINKKEYTMEIFSSIEEKRQMNVIKSLACEIRGDPRKLQIVQQFKKHHKIYEHEECKITYNIFDDPSHMRYKLDSLNASKVVNPFQAILNRNKSKKNKRYRRIMTLMNDSYSDKNKSSTSYKSRTDDRQSCNETPFVREEVYKKDKIWDYPKTRALTDVTDRKSTRKQSKELEKLSFCGQIKHRRCKSQEKRNSATLPSVPHQSQRQKAILVNYLQKRGIQGQMQSQKNLVDVLGNQYYEMSLRNRYYEQHKQPSFSYSIGDANGKPSKFVTKLRKLKPEMTGREKMVVKGINRMNKQKGVYDKLANR